MIALHPARSLILLLAATGCAVAMTAAPSASAQTADEAGAEALFREGKRLLEQHDYPNACAKLGESYRVDPATGTLLALAMCHEAAGKTATAWGEYADVASRSKNEGRADREQAARARVTALEPTLPTLAIVRSAGASDVAGLVVRRDGVEVGEGALGTPIPVDPGEHTIEVTAPGHVPWTSTVVIGASAQRKTMEIPALEAEGGSSFGTVRVAGVVAGALGVVGLGIGTGFGLKAISRKSDSQPGCVGNTCYDPASKQAFLDAQSAGRVSTAAFITGGALLATGVTLFVIGRPKEHAVTSFGVSPSGSFDRLILMLDGRF
jgi:hypothetical protein